MQLKNDLAVSLLDVISFERKKGEYQTSKRDFAALSFRLTADSTFIYQHGKVHAGTNDICLVPDGIAYTAETSAEKMIVVHFNMFNFATDRIQRLTPKCPTEFEDLFQQLLKIWQAKECGYEYLALSVFYKILSLMKAEEPFSPDQSPYEDAAEYIKHHFSNASLSITELAQNTHVCEALFRRNFKKIYGISPKKYLDQIRIKYAMLLLQSNYFSHREIAERCGFSDVKYFRTAFKNKTGICVSKYHDDAAFHSESLHKK